MAHTCWFLCNYFRLFEQTTHWWNHGQGHYYVAGFDVSESLLVESPAMKPEQFNINNNNK